MTTESKLVIITVDGACLGNGQSQLQSRAAAAGILNYRGRRRAVAEFIGQGTNQRAEVTAAALGLESLKEPCTVIIRSDSEYVVRTMKGEFKRRTNLDLWSRLDRAAQPHNVTYEWVKGHNGDSEQEAADKIARATAELGRINEVMLTEVAQRLENENLTSAVPRDRTKLRNYLFLNTMEHGYFLATPEELQAVLPLDQETLIPRHSDTLDLSQQPVKDSVGNQWILLEEDCQAPEFIEFLADVVRVFPHQIRERITHHETNISSAQLVAYIQNNDIKQLSTSH
jgi:ribonuclease HI